MIEVKDTNDVVHYLKWLDTETAMMLLTVQKTFEPNVGLYCVRCNAFVSLASLHLENAVEVKTMPPDRSLTLSDGVPQAVFQAETVSVDTSIGRKAAHEVARRESATPLEVEVEKTTKK